MKNIYILISELILLARLNKRYGRKVYILIPYISFARALCSARISVCLLLSETPLRSFLNTNGNSLAYAALKYPETRNTQQIYQRSRLTIDYSSTYLSNTKFHVLSPLFRLDHSFF